MFSGQSLLANAPVAVSNFFAGDPAGRDGVRVAVADLDSDPDADVVTAGGPSGRVTTYLGKDIAAGGPPPAAAILDPFPEFAGGVFVG